MHDRIRPLARVAAIAALAVLAAGLLILGVGSVIAGDLYALTLPWSGWGIDLTVAGLALTAITLGARVIVEPLGWWRLLAVPPTIVVTLTWAYLGLIGPSVAGAPCYPPECVVPSPDVGTALYSIPEYAAWLLAWTLLIGLPLVIGRFRRPTPAQVSTTSVVGTPR